MPLEDIESMSDVCKKVFEGKRFDDALFNEFIETFVQENIKH